VKYLSHASENKNSAAAHYMKKHGSVPLWVIVNIFDFGTIENFYKHMIDSERNEVARFYSEMYYENYTEKVYIDPETLSSFLANIRELRNVLAHDNKLIRFACRKSCVYFPPIHQYNKIDANSPRQDVFNIFLVMKVFLSAKDYSVLYNTLLKRSITLKNKLKTIPVSDIYKAYGFPENWDGYPQLEQQD
jgi:abortive infection bacteriophage resistance protein